MIKEIKVNNKKHIVVIGEKTYVITKFFSIKFNKSWYYFFDVHVYTCNGVIVEFLGTYSDCVDNQITDIDQYSLKVATELEERNNV